MNLTGFTRKSEDEILHNTKIKKYPNGLQKITVASRNIFREQGWELVNKPVKLVNVPKPQNHDNDVRMDSIKRAKDRIFDIVNMNEGTFKYFVTLTFDPEHVNSKSPADVIKILRSFLKNMTSRHDLSYILIPEYHKDGKIHLHGLISDGLQLADSGTRKAKGFEKPLKIETLKRKRIAPEDCKIVYNLPQWKYGYSTAEPISGSADMIFGYITKYITKDMQKIFGNFYYAGGEIIRNVPVTLTDTDYQSFECDREIYCEPARMSFKYKSVQN